MTVYVVQEPMYMDRETNQLKSKFDISAAREYGEVVILLPHQAKPFDASVVRELRRKLEDYGDGDFLLLTGNPCLMGFAAAIAADVADGKLRLLQYSGRDRRYVPVSADVFDNYEV